MNALLGTAARGFLRDRSFLAELESRGLRAAAGLEIEFVDRAGNVGPVTEGRVKGNVVARRGPREESQS